MSRGIGRRRSSDSALLWLWHRPAAAAHIRPLAWEVPSAVCAALKRPKRKENDAKMAQILDLVDKDYKSYFKDDQRIKGKYVQRSEAKYDHYEWANREFQQGNGNYF